MNEREENARSGAPLDDCVVSTPFSAGPGNTMWMQ